MSMLSNQLRIPTKRFVEFEKGLFSITNLPRSVRPSACKMLFDLREGVKYYFADFVHKWGTSLPRLFPENFSSKRAQNCVFCSKNT